MGLKAPMELHPAAQTTEKMRDFPVFGGVTVRQKPLCPGAAFHGACSSLRAMLAGGRKGRGWVMLCPGSQFGRSTRTFECNLVLSRCAYILRVI